MSCMTSKLSTRKRSGPFKCANSCGNVSRRLLALSEDEIAALMTAMRQLGVGSQGGANTLCHFPPAHLR